MEYTVYNDEISDNDEEYNEKEIEEIEEGFEDLGTKLDLNASFDINLCNIDSSFMCFYELIDPTNILISANMFNETADICASDETNSNYYHIQVPIEIKNYGNVYDNIMKCDDSSKHIYKFMISLPHNIKSNQGIIKLHKDGYNVNIVYKSSSHTYVNLTQSSHISDWIGKGLSLYNFSRIVNLNNIQIMLHNINEHKMSEETTYIEFKPSSNIKSIVINLLDYSGEHLFSLPLDSKIYQSKEKMVEYDDKGIKKNTKADMFLSTFEDVINTFDNNEVKNVRIYVSNDLPVVLEVNLGNIIRMSLV